MFKTIIAGVDGSPTARNALLQAVEMAKMSGARLHVISAYSDGTFAAALAATDPSGSVLALEVNEIQKDARAAADDLLAAAAKDAKGVDVETHAIAGEPAGAICDIAESIGADLIVVGNRGMTGAKRFLLGSVPNRIAHHAPCSVLIVHTT
ncbi:MAG: universal stress protein [Actinobacteria bacterium]|nr:universal stress protein [Actinomycetota bacterium]